MRIGLVSPYDLSMPGGVQAQVLGLAERLRRMGDEVLTIGPGLPDGEPGLDLGSSVGIRANGSVAPVSLNPAVLRRVGGVAGSVDVIHVHEPLMPLVSWAALRSETPLVATFHADPSRAMRRLLGLSEGVLRKVLGRVRVLTAASETARSSLPGSLRIRIIPNGVDCAGMRAEVARDPRRVVFLGRDEPRKGLDVLLEAWPQVSAAVPEADLVVIGRESGPPGITWMGRVGDQKKAELLSSAAVQVAPNLRGESFGIVVTEGMAAGAAVIASGLEAFREVGGEAVMYFPTGDADALARAIIRVLEDPSLQSRLSRAGMARAQLYDWERVTSAYRAAYSDAGT